MGGERWIWVWPFLYFILQFGEEGALVSLWAKRKKGKRRKKEKKKKERERWGELPESLWRARLIVNLIEGVDLAEGAKGAFQVVDDGPGHKGLGAVGGETGAEVDVMVDGRPCLVFGVGKVGFLASSIV